MPRGKKVENKDVKEKRSLEDIMAEKEEVLNNSMSEVEKRRAERRQQSELFKNIKNDLPILVYCNAGNTTVVYDCPKTGMSYKFKYGDMEYLTFEELKSMKSEASGLLENYILIPIDVNSEEYTIDDVLRILRIDDLYTEEMLIDGNIDYILNNTKLNVFKSIVNDCSKNYLRMILDRALELAKTEQLNDLSKMSYLEDVVGNTDHDLFKNVIDNYKQFKE
jgi:hypothetical protein